MVMREKQYKLRVPSTWPLFCWVTCLKCKREFRREKLWKRFVDEPGRRECYYVHACTRCCPNDFDAKDYFDTEPWIPDRPLKAPAAPPSER